MTVSDHQLQAAMHRLGEGLAGRGWRLACAESCTGGWLAKLATDIAGSSAWFDRGWVCYSNAAKREQLGVTDTLLQAHGAVSGEVVQAMVRGALARSQAGLAVAISGIAGPGGGSVNKPVGTVWLAWGGPADALPPSRRLRLDGDRDGVRRQALLAAIAALQERLDRDPP